MNQTDLNSYKTHLNYKSPTVLFLLRSKTYALNDEFFLTLMKFLAPLIRSNLSRFQVHSGVVEPNGDSVEELHNGFFCISDPAVISEIPCDDFTKRDEADVQPPMPLPKTDHAFLTNSISRADWSIESITTVQTNWGNSNPLTRLAALPELAEVVEIDGWRFGTNAIFRSIDVLKNFYRFSDVLRMGIKHSFWAFCRNLCALHGYYVRAFIYDLNDLGEREISII